MFKKFIETFQKKSLSEQILEKAVGSISLGKQMYLNAKTALRTHGNIELAKSVLQEDKTINKSERSIRRKLLTHFALTDKIDIGSGFAISSIVIDIERIGDYTKNIADLAILMEDKYNSGPYDERVKKIEEEVESMFDKTIMAFENNNDKVAREVIALYKEKLSYECSLIRDAVVKEEEEMSTPNAVVTVLYLRSLKRIAAHLYNICTSIINPFPRIGYKEKTK
jgi:phosphate uptake regulator